MLSNEVMGAFCLGVVWLNTLLICAQVWQAQRALSEERALLGTIMEARVLDVGDAASLAELRIAQVGRAITTGGPDRILFTESSRSAHLHAGTVEAGGKRLAVVLVGSPRVWSLAAEGARDAAAFDRAFAQANTNRGLTSELRVAVGAPGAKVWLAGERDAQTVSARLVSDRDPNAVLVSARKRAFAFIVLSVAVLGGVTAIAMVPPWFTGVSTLGGILAVAYFLAVQPVAVALREAIAVPDKRLIGGIWSRS